CRAAEGISSSQLWQPKCEEAVDESFFEERVRRPFINLSSTAAFVRQAFASNAVIVGRKVSKIGPGCMPTNQKVGSSNLSGRTTESTTGSTAINGGRSLPLTLKNAVCPEVCHALPLAPDPSRRELSVLA